MILVVLHASTHLHACIHDLPYFDKISVSLPSIIFWLSFKGEETTNVEFAGRLTKGFAELHRRSFVTIHLCALIEKQTLILSWKSKKADFAKVGLVENWLQSSTIQVDLSLIRSKSTSHLSSSNILEAFLFAQLVPWTWARFINGSKAMKVD